MAFFDKNAIALVIAYIVSPQVLADSKYCEDIEKLFSYNVKLQQKLERMQPKEANTTSLKLDSIGTECDLTVKPLIKEETPAGGVVTKWGVNANCDEVKQQTIEKIFHSVKDEGCSNFKYDIDYKSGDGWKLGHIFPWVEDNSADQKGMNGPFITLNDKNKIEWSNVSKGYSNFNISEWSKLRGITTNKQACSLIKDISDKISSNVKQLGLIDDIEEGFSINGTSYNYLDERSISNPAIKLPNAHKCDVSVSLKREINGDFSQGDVKEADFHCQWIAANTQQAQSLVYDLGAVAHSCLSESDEFSVDSDVYLENSKTFAEQAIDIVMSNGVRVRIKAYDMNEKKNSYKVRYSFNYEDYKSQ